MLLKEHYPPAYCGNHFVLEGRRCEPWTVEARATLMPDLLHPLQTKLIAKPVFHFAGVLGTFSGWLVDHAPVHTGPHELSLSNFPALYQSRVDFQKVQEFPSASLDRPRLHKTT